MSGSANIEKIEAREVLNYRGNPTVEAEVLLADGSYGHGAVAAGISAGINEVGALLDGDKKRFAGRGTLKAVENVLQKIGPAIIGMDATDHAAVDRIIVELDGTPNKANLGGNAVLAVSLAVAKAEMKVSLQEALNSMEPIDREVLALRHFEQLTNSEVAQELDISDAAATKRYLRALERLRQLVPNLHEFFSR